MLLLDYIKRYSLECGNFPILEDEINGELTFANLEEYTGRIYAYLKTKSFEKEEIILIRVNQSYRTYLAMIGIWKMGLPFVVIGDKSPIEYQTQTENETKSKYCLNEEELDKALKFEYLEGYIPRSDNDLGLIIYTSGSSGLFKGVMHEFGALEEYFKASLRYSKLYPGKKSSFSGSKFFMSSGFFSTTAIVNLVQAIAYKATLFIPTFEHSFNPRDLIELARQNNIHSIDCVPRDVEQYANSNIPSLKELLVCYEIGPIKYHDKIDTYSFYGLSEALGSICYFPVDKDYELCPIGKPADRLKFILADENGKPITTPNTIGEFAFIPIHFRGYLCHEDIYKKAMHGKYYYTGDMGYLNEEGNYVCVGRKIDILKISKNEYIIPILISNCIKRYFGDIKDCYTKIFKDNDEIVVATYYIAERTFSLVEIHNAISKEIPQYSLPTHLVKIDELHYTNAGKFNRLAFEKPAK